MFGNTKAMEEKNRVLLQENEALKNEIDNLKSEIESLNQRENCTKDAISENQLKTELTNTMLDGCGTSVKEIQKDIEQNLEASKEISILSEETVTRVGTLDQISNEHCHSLLIFYTLLLSHEDWLIIFTEVLMKSRV